MSAEADLARKVDRENLSLVLGCWSLAKTKNTVVGSRSSAFGKDSCAMALLTTTTDANDE
jgi:hypothetical protein